jgi:hypothetical protein
MDRISRFTLYASRRVLLLLLWMAMAAAVPLPAVAQSPHHAALIVDFGDGRVVVRVVSFTGETISGVELLQQSGLDVAVLVNPGGGAALCAVEGVGCAPTPQECFCQCRGTPCSYWSYFHLQEGAWVYAGMGAANHVLRDGGVDGWIWGDGRTPPPLLAWDEIWARAGAAGPTPLPPPTAPPRPPASAVPPPTTVPPTARPATRAPETSGGPTVPPTVLHQPTPVPAALTMEASPPASSPSPLVRETSRPAPTPAPPAAESTGGIPWGSLAAFGGLVLLLAALGLWMRRRR